VALPPVPEALVDELEALHAEVDAQVAPLARRHQARLRCGRGCSGCCVDDLTVFEIEAARIVRHQAELLAHADPHPEGGCAFLDSEGACRIYPDRPYVCRTQGLPLRWMEEVEAATRDVEGCESDGDVVEMRDICPLNQEEDAPLETLAAEECWTIGPVEERLARLQVALDGGQGRRVRLRDLLARR
jgi:uncharacterized protein